MIEPRTLDTESLLPLKSVEHRPQSAGPQNKPHAGELVVDSGLAVRWLTDDGVDRQDLSRNGCTVL